ARSSCSKPNGSAAAHDVAATRRRAGLPPRTGVPHIDRSGVFMKMTSIIVLAAGLALTSVRAAAQTVGPKGYVGLNVAGQTQDVTVASRSTFSLFGETGSTNFSQTVGKGLVFDGGAGYFVKKNLSIGVTVSLFTRSPEATVSVATPDPIAFNSFTV